MWATVVGRINDFLAYFIDPPPHPRSMTNLEALQVLHGIQRKLLYVDQKLNESTLKEKCHMLDPTVAKVIKEIADDTDAVAARIQKFIDDAKTAGSVSAAEIVAALQPEADRLSALGSDPSNPVPTV